MSFPTHSLMLCWGVGNPNDLFSWQMTQFKPLNKVLAAPSSSKAAWSLPMVAEREPSKRRLMTASRATTCNASLSTGETFHFMPMPPLEAARLQHSAIPCYFHHPAKLLSLLALRTHAKPPFYRRSRLGMMHPLSKRQIKLKALTVYNQLPCLLLPLKLRLQHLSREGNCQGSRVFAFTYMKK